MKQQQLKLLILFDNLFLHVHVTGDSLHVLFSGTGHHDIAKIGVPDRILNNTGALTDEEFSFIQSHPQNGEKILHPLHSLNGIRDVVLFHHERYDGTGYPSG